MSDLAALEERALAELKGCPDEGTLQAWHTRYFGKQGEVQTAVKAVGALPPAEKPAYGQRANQVKEVLTCAYEAAKAAQKERALARSLRRRRWT
jgi:phenylalanyl-tRNA synthetase alpha chain